MMRKPPWGRLSAMPQADWGSSLPLVMFYAFLMLSPGARRCLLDDGLDHAVCRACFRCRTACQQHSHEIHLLHHGCWAPVRQPSPWGMTGPT